MSKLISQEAFDSAVAKGRDALAKPHAVDARFSARTHLLTVKFSNGFQCAFDVRQAPVLRDHPEADFSSPYVTPGGDGLIFDKANLSVGLPALVAPFLPEDVARYRVASVMGSMRTMAKAIASKSNGAKGGRPRKKPEHAAAEKSSQKLRRSTERG